MTTFRTRYLICPNCKCTMYTYELSSFYVSKSIYYSDGKSEFIPFTTPYEEIGICPECKNAFWKEDVLDIEQMEGEYPNLLSINDLDIALSENSKYEIAKWYDHLLKKGFAETKNREIQIRIKIWHILNDINRNSENNLFYKFKNSIIINTISPLFNFNNKNKFPPNIKKLFDDNLNRLIETYDTKNDENKLLKAEMHRELGDFLGASVLLNEIKSENRNHHYHQIKKVNNRKKSIVICVN